MSEILSKINSLAIFAGVREKEPLKSLANFMRKVDEVGVPQDDIIEAYTDFVARLYDTTDDADFSKAMWHALVNTDNPYLRLAIEGEKSMSRLTQMNAERELDLLTEISNISYNDIEKFIYYEGYLPQFKSSGIDIRKRYEDLLENISTKGYGIYAEYLMFKIEGNKVLPVKRPDTITVDDLFCYDRQRKMLDDNTKAFLKNAPAQDALLYGDMGTGKSSTVKAIARKYRSEGLRLVEIPKKELLNLQDIIDGFSQIPMKFIFFIDDVSFEPTDERIGSLKSILEGAAAGQRKNIIIYATSNRRHMIKETFADRTNEIHLSDTIAETMSLSERFGLQINFEKPNKQTYLGIVEGLCQKNNIDTTDETKQNAEQFALRKGGRSARVACQFVDSLVAGQ